MYQTNQMRKWESSKLLVVVEGYWIAVVAKPLHVVDENFCSVLTDDTNCKYLDRLSFGASTTQCKPAKNGGPTEVCRPSLRCLSQQKNGEEEEKSMCS